MLAPFACQDSAHARRLFHESPCELRTAFARDRDRISRSYAFRRLKRTTQVFPSSDHPKYRTRLTHSLEVAQTARILARNLNVNEDLAEAVSLAHDLGHPPFGHCGEDMLNACTQPHFPFNHNDQTFRWVTLLEKSYVNFDGLNLCWDTLEGIVKHNGPLSKDDLVSLPTIGAFADLGMDLELSTFASLEAQIAAISDDITYNNHDLEDGVQAGYITVDQLLAEVPYFAKLHKSCLQGKAVKDPSRFVFELVRGSLQAMVQDVLAVTKSNLQRRMPVSVWDIRYHDGALVQFSREMAQDIESLRAFLFKNIYRSERLEVLREQGAQKLRRLFAFLAENPTRIPPAWRPKTRAKAAVLHGVCDYIASKTEYDLEDDIMTYHLEKDCA